MLNKRKIKKFYRKHRMWPTYILAAALAALLTVLLGCQLVVKAQLINPLVENNDKVHVFFLPLPENEDTWVTKYANKYGHTLGEVNHTRELLHCLLYNESGYGANKGHGDGGNAGGPLQFWDETWTRMRKQMIKENLVKEIGSKYDMEQAINTAAWALNSSPEKTKLKKVNYSLEWGPILRSYCQ